MTFKIKEGINVGAVPVIDNQSKFQQVLGVPNMRPTLNIDFINQQSIDPRMSYTRASSATHINSKGFVTAVGNNVPRFEYDPVTGQPTGLLIEDQRTNLAYASSKFDVTAAWTPANARIEPDTTILAPDGSTTAFKITSTATPFARLNTGYTLTAQPYSWSMFVKPGTALFIHATFEIAGVQVARFFGDLTTLATSSTVSYGTITVSPSLTSVGNGWYRFAGVVTIPAGAGGGYSMYMGPANALGTVNATVGEYMWIWGAQLEAATYSSTTSYIPTAETFTSRASLASYIDSTDSIIKYAGVNLLTYSNTFTDASWYNGGNTIWVANADYAPNGTNTAWRLIMPLGAGTYGSHAVSLTSGVTYVFSVYVKSSSTTPTISLIFESSPGSGSPLTSTNITATDAWTRYTLTYTAAATATYYVAFDNQGNGVASDVLVWGAQVEVGTTPTLYAATTSSTTAAGRPIYNPVTKTNSSVMYEPATTNYMLYSGALDQSPWAVSNVSLTTNTTDIYAPDGTYSAEKVTDVAATSAHFVEQMPISSVPANQVWTYSVYLRARERRYCRIVVRDSTTTNGFAVGYDLIGKVMQPKTVYGTGTLISYSMVAMPNGWWRCILTGTTDTTSTAMRVGLYMEDVFGTLSYTGDITKSMYMWGAQLETGYYASSYIPTTSTTATRSADVLSYSQTTRQYDSLLTANFDWMNFNQGTFVVDYDVNNYAATPLVVYSQNAEYVTSRYYNVVGTWNGVSEVNAAGNNANTMVFASFAVSYGSGIRAMSLNGATANTGTGAFNTSPPPYIAFGGDGGNRPIGGHLKRALFYPYTAANTELQALSRV